MLEGRGQYDADDTEQANAFQPGWGQTIFQSANEMANNIALREKLNAIQSQVESEREWWEKRKASIQADFMKELDEEKERKGSMGGKVAEKSSDGEDGVLVEREVGGKSGGQGGGGGGKKKKGKK